MKTLRAASFRKPIPKTNCAPRLLIKIKMKMKMDEKLIGDYLFSESFVCGLPLPDAKGGPN